MEDSSQGKKRVEAVTIDPARSSESVTNQFREEVTAMARRQQVQIERRRSSRAATPAPSVVVPTRPIADTRPATDLLARIDRVLGHR